MSSEETNTSKIRLTDCKQTIFITKALFASENTMKMMIRIEICSTDDSLSVVRFEQHRKA